jgi:hypothetical protein
MTGLPLRSASRYEFRIHPAISETIEPSFRRTTKRVATGLAPRKELKRRPFLGLHPGFAVPPALLPIATSVPPRTLALGSRRLRMAGVHSSFPSERPSRLSSLIQSNSGPISRVYPLPPNTLTSSYYCRHSNKHAQTKPNSLGLRFSGAAFGWSSFLTFVSRRSLALRSAPPVNPACAALLGAYPKTAPCSLPRP